MPHTQGTSRYFSTRDGRRLHTAQLDGPRDAPVVVFEAGAGGTRSSWGTVQPAVARFARAVVYDRSGLGRSEPDAADRTFGRMADDLNDLLDGLDDGDGARFVLVGHSLGGVIVRLAASRRPDRIAGLVLVDPSDEAADDMFREGAGRRAAIMMTVMRGLARTGILRLLGGLAFRRAPADVRADLAREATTPRAIDTMAQELKTFYPELQSWRGSAPDLGDLPVTVVSGAKSGGLGKAVRARVNEAHAGRAAASPAGRHVVAANSGHQVPLTDPEVIVDEVRRLVAGPAMVD
ncbi:alpha/beta fold hydrolase [Tsukamurella paurometabola]|uniref:Sigma factor sigB regulation protein rsbQ n=1 Tax=Tsukamurella paurometabola TaxID=2061 RepID=A0A3P8MCP3_TSUPA|nr:alpha/beta hydrolase [Tsukamurella paurometabola]UEA83692.1 alpha/beta hydrolase [Tsukamurella paurometabola]VDR40830.1 Sigma factor sigB regulation protein rsbQ [Tsukamurella paurometabola]